MAANLTAGAPGRSGNSWDTPPILPLTVTSTVLVAGSGEVNVPETSAGILPEVGLIWVYSWKSSRVAVASWSRVTGPTEAGARPTRSAAAPKRYRPRTPSEPRARVSVSPTSTTFQLGGPSRTLRRGGTSNHHLAVRVRAGLPVWERPSVFQGTWMPARPATVGSRSTCSQLPWSADTTTSDLSHMPSASSRSITWPISRSV